MKKLYRSQADRRLCGLMGGIGEYLEVDPTVVRLLFVLISLLTGIIPAMVTYFIACIVVPQAPSVSSTEEQSG